MTIYNVLHRQVTQTVDPADEPVGLSEMREHLRVDHTDEDLLILAVTQAAREVVEKKLARNLVQRTLRADIDSWAEQIHLPLPPVASISSVKYYDTESPSVLQTLAAAEYEFSGSAGRIYRAYGTTWPDIYPRHDAIQITYLSGHASTSSPVDYGENVPQPLRSAIKLIAADLYENREGNVVGQGFVAVPNRTLEFLIEPYRSIK